MTRVYQVKREEVIVEVVYEGSKDRRLLLEKDNLEGKLVEIYGWRTITIDFMYKKIMGRVDLSKKVSSKALQRIVQDKLTSIN